MSTITDARPVVQAPQPAGPRRTFGFGDRLGLATPGQLAAVRKTDFFPMFAQLSRREMSRLGRDSADVMDSARTALEAAGYDQPWGADADHLKTPEDIGSAFAAGFRSFSVDSSAFVTLEADELSADELKAHETAYIAEEIFPKGGVERLHHVDREHEISENLTLRFTRETLLRAAVKYGKALAHFDSMAKHAERVCEGVPHEIEFCVDEAPAATAPIEHLFIALELKRRGISPGAISLCFVRGFERGIDYRGSLEMFEASLSQHVAIARSALPKPYRVSIHGGSEKLSVCPVLGRVCGDLLHLKTSGVSYLEAMKLVLEKDPALFGEVLRKAIRHFEGDRLGYRISTTLEEVQALAQVAPDAIEEDVFGSRAGRQLLHVTYGTILGDGRDDAESLSARVVSLVRAHQVLYCERLELLFDLYFATLDAG